MAYSHHVNSYHPSIIDHGRPRPGLDRRTRSLLNLAMLQAGRVQVDRRGVERDVDENSTYASNRSSSSRPSQKLVPVAAVRGADVLAIPFPRRMSILDAARDAAGAGFRGIVAKSHH